MDTPWTTNQMRENSSKWTLEGDAKLLLYLQEFSNDLCEKTRATKEKIDVMISTLDYTNIALANSTNRFHALQHSQFVESRVYEEDIVSNSSPKKDVITKEVKSDPAIIAKQAVMCGLKLMHSEFVKIPITDDLNNPRFKFIAKDKYETRPLPPRIGSKEFLSSLNPSESESEVGFGSSRSRSSSIASSKSKSCSPLLGFSSHKYDSPSIAKENSSLFAHSSEEEDDNLSQSKVLSKSHGEYFSEYDKFAVGAKNITDKDKLNVKLGSNYPILFNDGPPILDDISVGNKTRENNLFDKNESEEDEEDDKLFDATKSIKKTLNNNCNLFHGQNEDKPKAVNLFDEEPPEIKSISDKPNISNVPNLFDDDDSDSNDLFADSKRVNENFNTNKTLGKIGIFSEKPPEDTISKAKGAIRKTNLSTNFAPALDVKTVEKEKTSEKLKLFEDDNVDKFDNNIFSNELSSSDTLKMPFNLFDDEPPLDFNEKSKFTSESRTITNSNNVNKTFSLFSDSDDEDIFSNLIKNDNKCSEIDTKSKINVLLNNSCNTTKNTHNEAVKAESTNNKFSEKRIESSQKQDKFFDLFEDEDDLFSTEPNINKNKASQNLPQVKLVGNETNLENKDSIVNNINNSINIDKNNILKNEQGYTSNIKSVVNGDGETLDQVMQDPTKEDIHSDIKVIDVDKSKHSLKFVDDIFDTSEDEKQLFQTKPKPSIEQKPLKSVQSKTNSDNNSKINLSKNPNIKTKIIGIFEDPIYRDLNTNQHAFDNNSSNNYSYKTDQAKIFEQKSSKPISNKREEACEDTKILSNKVEQKKSLYEEAASNLALFEDEPPLDIFEDISNSRKPNKRLTLFDDEEDEPDFVQSLTKNKHHNKKEPFGIGLFDSEPPLDTNFESKDKNNITIYKSDEDLFASIHVDSTSRTTNFNPEQQLNKKIETDLKSKSSVIKTNEPKKLSKLPNLNINVSALLPGARPPSLNIKQVEQNANVLDSKSVTTKQNEDLLEKLVINKDENEVKNKKNISIKIDKINEHRSGDFVHGTDTLQNTAVKERAKIPQKRRPPSRRARQEALRKSLILENSDAEIDSLSIEENKTFSSFDSMDSDIKLVTSEKAFNKDTDTTRNTLSGIINSLPPDHVFDNDDLKTVLKIDHKDDSKCIEYDSRSVDQMESTSINKDGTDILSPSTEEDDIFKIDKVLEDDTMKVDDYNSIFNDSDDDIDDLSNEFDFKSEELKHDQIKSRKEFNILDALSTSKQTNMNVASVKDDASNSEFLFESEGCDIKPEMGLKPVPEVLDITLSKNQKSSKANIEEKTVLPTNSKQTLVSDKSMLIDKTSTLAIDGSAEFISSSKVNKTSKDILFDSDLEDDLFTAKPIALVSTVQEVTQKGDAKPKSLLDSDETDDLFISLQRSNIVIRKNHKVENLFSDTDDDDDLFKVKSIKTSKSSTDKILGNAKKTSDPKSASLFGDSDDDDDLFKVSRGKFS